MASRSCRTQRRRCDEIHPNLGRFETDGRGALCTRSAHPATVVAMFADGMSEVQILAAYPDLERDDIYEALQYAAEAVCERELPLVAP
jgi:hypothetical protein